MAFRNRIAPPPAEYKSYLYRYTNLENDKQYLGVHKGAVNDTYTHSSKNSEFVDSFQKALESEKLMFEFEVIEYSYSYELLLNKEHHLLTEVDARTSDKYYNLHNGQFKYKGPNLKKVKELYDLIQSDTFPIEKEDLSIHESMMPIQVRYREIDIATKNTITDLINEADGSSDGCSPVMVFEEYHLNEDGTREDRRGDGTHSVNGLVDSEKGKDVPVKRIPRKVHSKYTTAEIKRVCNLLNKRQDVIFKKPCNIEDMVKDFTDNFFEHGVIPEAEENKDFLKELGFTKHFLGTIIKKTKNNIEVLRMKALHKNFVDYKNVPKNIKEINEEVDRWNAMPDWCAFKSSSESFKLSRVAEILREHDGKHKDKEGNIIPLARNVMVVMHHPSVASYHAWNDKFAKDENGDEKVRVPGIESEWIDAIRYFTHLDKLKSDDTLKVHFTQMSMWIDDGSK